MERKVEVMEVFDTEAGLVAILKFPAGLAPQSGKTFLVKDEHSWRVKSISVHSTPAGANLKLAEQQKQGLWHCVLESITHGKVNAGDKLMIA